MDEGEVRNSNDEQRSQENDPKGIKETISSPKAGRIITIPQMD
jgi:hypothetical protein